MRHPCFTLQVIAQPIEGVKFHTFPGFNAIESTNQTDLGNQTKACVHVSKDVFVLLGCHGMNDICLIHHSWIDMHLNHQQHFLSWSINAFNDLEFYLSVSCHRKPRQLCHIWSGWMSLCSFQIISLFSISFIHWLAGWTYAKFL